MTMQPTHVIIAGAGYGGLAVAMNLAKSESPTRITVLDRFEHHLLQTRLPQVAGGALDPRQAALPLTALLSSPRVEHRPAAVRGFDLAQHRVLTDRGPWPYDLLVIALGSEPEDYKIPGLRQHALRLKTLEDAQRISAHIQRALLRASPQRQPEASTFVIGGGGASGVELAAELAHALPRWASPHGLSPGRIRLVLVEAQERTLPASPPWMSRYATRALTRMGIEIRLGQPIVEVTDESVRLATGEEIHTQTTMWTGGVRAPWLEADLPLGPGRRIWVDPYLRAMGHPEVFAIGDVALIVDPHTGRPLEPSAQWAVQQGSAVARNIANFLKGRPEIPYRPRRAGELISLGPTDGVGRIGPLRLRGRPARWAKQLNEVRYLLTLGAWWHTLKWGLPMISASLDEK
ncbi:MAG: NAD(P)/FAD-dependent oxidoreductase [Chloroflexi bacterium]|nr:NAD(P)/FAD-dependent oxidoreductase [Chloroflexota bacterium]